MGSIFKQQYTVLNPETGKRETRKSKKWYIEYRKGDRTVREPAYTDRVASMAKLTRREQEVAREAEGIFDHFTAELARPIAEQVAEFAQHLSDRGGTDGHRDQTAQRLRSVLALGGIKSIRELTPVRVDAAISALARGDGDSPGLSNGSCNHYLRAAKSFAKWLVDNRKSPDNAIAGMRFRPTKGFETKLRRPLTQAEFNRLLVATVKAGTHHDVAPADRQAIYLLAAFTGYRRREIAKLTPESFKLDGDSPHVTLEARHTKNRRQAGTPLNPHVAEFFRRYLRARKPGAIIWPIALTRTAEMLREDMAAAGLAVKAGKSVVDFHSLRQVFITGLALAGVAPKVAQQLARHSTIDLTMNVYAQATSDDERAAVGLLAAPEFLTRNLTGGTAKSANGMKRRETVTRRQPPRRAPVKLGRKPGKQAAKRRKRGRS